MRKACPHPVHLIERPAFSSVDLNDFMQSGQLNLIMRDPIISPMRDFDKLKKDQQHANASCSLQSAYPQTARSSMDLSPNHALIPASPVKRLQFCLAKSNIPI
jgi:hypothetical protein